MDEDKEYECPVCSWEGRPADMGDDGPGYEYCCPECSYLFLGWGDE